ncbi:MAG: hypothetical protein JNL13_05730 [Chitinophagaceae bacterium]|nr:hypothetical protein [Chitinophagaceae bacterium]
MRPDKYIQTEQFLHNMARILGAIGQAYLPAEPDFSHTNMNWKEQQNLLQTRDIPIPGGAGILLSFHPHELHFHITCTHLQKNDIVITKGNALSFVLGRIAQALKAYGLDSQAFQSGLQYRFPQWNDVDGRLLQPEKQYLKRFEQLRSGANKQLKDFLEQNRLSSEVRIWPGNFDTGIYCRHDSRIEQYAGYAPADQEAYSRPYYYNSFLVNRKRIIPHHFPRLQHTYWETQKWGGAILPSDAFRSWEDFLNAAPVFLQQTSDTFLKEIKNRKLEKSRR